MQDDPNYNQEQKGCPKEGMSGLGFLLYFHIFLSMPQNISSHISCAQMFSPSTTAPICTIQVFGVLNPNTALSDLKVKDIMAQISKIR